MEPDKQLETQHTNKGLSEVFSSKREELEQLLEKKFEPALKLLTESELKTLLIAQDFRNSIAHFSIYDSTHYSNKEAKTLPKDEEELIAHLIQHGTGLLDELVEHLREVVDKELSAYQASPTLEGYVKLWCRSDMIESCSSRVSNLGYSIKVNKEILREELDGRIKAGLCATNEPLRDALCKPSNWEQCIAVMAMSSERDMAHYLNCGFAQHLVQALRPTSMLQDEVGFLARLDRLARFLNNVGEQKYEEYHAIFKIEGRSMIYKLFSGLIREDTSWIFHNPKTRSVLAPLIVGAIEDYRKHDQTKSGEPFHLAQFVEHTVTYSQESLRRAAVRAGARGPLERISFGHGLTSIAQDTIDAAASQFRALASDYIKITREQDNFYRDLHYALRQGAELSAMVDEDQQGRGRLLQRFFNRHTAKALTIVRQYLEEADEDQRTVWRALIHDEHDSLYQALVSSNIPAQTLEDYITRAGTYADPKPILLLQSVTDKEVLTHLLEISQGDEVSLKKFCAEFEPESGFDEANLSRETILEATSLDQLLATLAAQFKIEHKELLSRVLAELRARSFTGAGRRDGEYVKTVTDKAPVTLEASIAQVFSSDSILTPEEFLKMLKSNKFLHYLSGEADLTMKIAPTEACSVVLSTPLDDLLRLFPDGLFEDLESLELPQDLSEEQLEQLRAQRLQARNFILELALHSISELRTELGGNLEKLIQENFMLQESIWQALLEYDQGDLGSFLQSIGVEPLTATMQIIPKSDPRNWLISVSDSRLTDPYAAMLDIAYGERHTSVGLVCSEDGQSVIMTSRPGVEWDGMSESVNRATIEFLKSYLNNQVSVLTSEGAINQRQKELLLGPVYRERELDDAYPELEAEVINGEVSVSDKRMTVYRLYSREE